MKGIKVLLVLLGAILFISGCNSGSKVSSADVVSKFKEAGLEAENAKQLGENDDIKIDPDDGEATRFYLPSIQDTATGHVFVFNNQDDLNEVKTFYEDLGKQSELFKSWTYAKDNILLHLNGSMPEEQFNKYKEVLDSL
ncbi:stress protein [Paenibacillus illinoisensis]|uniref:stress protein n=1 Tax=Paenibacillus illinoisensis TaxID=59845 RepID=UPI00301C5FA2